MIVIADRVILTSEFVDKYKRINQMNLKRS